MIDSLPSYRSQKRYRIDPFEKAFVASLIYFVVKICSQNDVKVEIFYIMPLFLLFSFLFSMMLFRAQHADHKRPNDDEYHSQSSVVLNAEINPDVEFRVELIELLNELKNTVF